MVNTRSALLPTGGGRGTTEPQTTTGAWLTPAGKRPAGEEDDEDAEPSSGGAESHEDAEAEAERVADAGLAALRLVFDQYIRSHAALCAGSDGSGSEGFSRDGVLKSPLPSSDMESFNRARPVLTAAAIIALVYIWAGFLGVVLSLYLLSAEVWRDEPDAVYSMVTLAAAGAVMVMLAIGGFYESRRGDACVGVSLVVTAVVVQLVGGMVIGVLDLPFAFEAAVGVLGLQILPALLVLLGYGLLRCYQSRMDEMFRKQQEAGAASFADGETAAMQFRYRRSAKLL